VLGEAPDSENITCPWFRFRDRGTTNLRRTFGDGIVMSFFALGSQQPSASTRRNAGSFTKARYTRRPRSSRHRPRGVSR
jgi:hypothetical protein